MIAEPGVAIGFGLAGAATRPVSGAESARAAFAEALGSGASLLVVTADVEAMLGDSLGAHRLKGGYPLVAVLPTMAGRAPAGGSIVGMIREAVGIHV